MNIQAMMKQAQEMQQRLQKQMADMRVEATAGGGMVTVTVDGHKHLRAIKIDPEVVSKDDTEMLQDLIVAAINDAHRKVDEALSSQMKGLMGGMPGLMEALERTRTRRIPQSVLDSIARGRRTGSDPTTLRPPPPDSDLRVDPDVLEGD